jgi:hypothetical protein
LGVWGDPPTSAKPNQCLRVLVLWGAARVSSARSTSAIVGGSESPSDAPCLTTAWRPSTAGRCCYLLVAGATSHRPKPPPPLPADFLSFFAFWRRIWRLSGGRAASCSFIITCLIVFGSSPRAKASAALRSEANSVTKRPTSSIVLPQVRVCVGRGVHSGQGAHSASVRRTRAFSHVPVRCRCQPLKPHGLCTTTNRLGLFDEQQRILAFIRLHLLNVGGVPRQLLLTLSQLCLRLSPTAKRALLEH